MAGCCLHPPVDKYCDSADRSSILLPCGPAPDTICSPEPLGPPCNQQGLPIQLMTSVTQHHGQALLQPGAGTNWSSQIFRTLLAGVSFN